MNTKLKDILEVLLLASVFTLATIMVYSVYQLDSTHDRDIIMRIVWFLYFLSLVLAVVLSYIGTIYRLKNSKENKFLDILHLVLETTLVIIMVGIAGIVTYQCGLLVAVGDNRLVSTMLITVGYMWFITISMYGYAHTVNELKQFDGGK